MNSAGRENLMTLEQMLGLEKSTAENILDSTVIITADSEDSSARYLAKNLKKLLELTIKKVVDNSKEIGSASLEIVVGAEKPRSNLPHIYIAILPDKIIINRERENVAKDNLSIHEILLLIGACYSSARVIQELIGDDFIFPIQERLVLKYSDIAGENYKSYLEKTVDLKEVYLVGAGAVGNGFILGLSTFKVSGELIVVDPDIISGGNLNRCALFKKEDVGKNKAVQLIKRSQQILPEVKMHAKTVTLEKLSKPNEPDWLKKLVVTVDSRRARRNIQSEIPGEVFDASTTGIEEIVLHYHKRPLSDEACLECIYHKEKQESQREKHIAETLGVSLREVQSQTISTSAAKKICNKDKSLDEESIVGEAYDSFFKSLCGEGQLLAAADKQIFAPLSFVSILAGAYLAIEFIKRFSCEGGYNYWRVSPWAVPNLGLQQSRKTNKKCSFCNDEIKKQVAEEIW